MVKLKLLFLSLILSLGVNIIMAQDTIRVMHYNLLYYGKNTDYCTSSNNYIDNKNQNLRTIIQHVKPDIFTVNELDGNRNYPVLDDAVYLLENALNVDGIDYYRRTGFPEVYLANTLFYNSNKLILISHTPISFYSGGYPKIFNAYKFYFNSIDLETTNDTAYFSCLVAHLKAGKGSSEESLRAYESGLIMDYYETLGEKGNYLLMGDFNVYTPTESAFQNFINPDNSLYTFYDPADQIGEWSANYDYRDYHSQSTHLSSGCASGGGMDDRFDFILVSDYIMQGSDHYQYIEDSYKTIGQDGSRYNNSLNTTSNSSVPNNIAQALYNMSDHLPVYLELKIDQNLGEPLQIDIPGKEKVTVSINNPAKDYLKFTIDLHWNDIINVEIYSVLGELKYRQQFQNCKELVEGEISVTDFAEGVYIFNVSDKNGLIYSTKVIIQN